jgi:hypothetical protein
MEEIFVKYQQKLQLTSVGFVRSVLNQINCDA